MIRFIDLGDQIIEDYPAFAWYDTVTDTFENYGGSEAWETWKEFEEDYWAEEDVVPETHSLDRYRSLFPKKWFEMHHPKKGFIYFLKLRNIKINKKAEKKKHKGWMK